MANTLFQKMMAGELPGEFCYEDKQCIALEDINPQAPTHLLVIPRKPVPRLAEAEEADLSLLGHLLLVARRLARERQLEDGFRAPSLSHGTYQAIIRRFRVVLIQGIIRSHNPSWQALMLLWLSPVLAI